MLQQGQLSHSLGWDVGNGHLSLSKSISPSLQKEDRYTCLIYAHRIVVGAEEYKGAVPPAIRPPAQLPGAGPWATPLPWPLRLHPKRSSDNPVTTSDVLSLPGGHPARPSEPVGPFSGEERRGHLTS